MIGYFDDAMKFLLFFLGVILELCYMGKMSPFRRSMFKYLGTKCHVCNLFSNASAKRQRKKRERKGKREGGREERRHIWRENKRNGNKAREIKY